jgi:DNA-binding ferritin-like protein
VESRAERRREIGQHSYTKAAQISKHDPVVNNSTDFTSRNLMIDK